MISSMMWWDPRYRRMYAHVNQLAVYALFSLEQGRRPVLSLLNASVMVQRNRAFTSNELTPARIYKIAMQICQGMVYLHKQKVWSCQSDLIPSLMALLGADPSKYLARLFTET